MSVRHLRPPKRQRDDPSLCSFEVKDPHRKDAKLEGYVAVCGGLQDKSCELYRISRGKWVAEALPDLAMIRGNHSSCFRGGTLYVFCGGTINGRIQSTSVEALQRVGTSKQAKSWSMTALRSPHFAI